MNRIYTNQYSKLVQFTLDRCLGMHIIKQAVQKQHGPDPTGTRSVKRPLTKEYGVVDDSRCRSRDVRASGFLSPFSGDISTLTIEK